jgi:hypothetical protein
MDEVREEEWLGILEEMDGVHLLRLVRASGFLIASFRSSLRPYRRHVRLQVKSNSPVHLAAVTFFEDRDVLVVRPISRRRVSYKTVSLLAGEELSVSDGTKIEMINQGFPPVEGKIYRGFGLRFGGKIPRGLMYDWPDEV